MEKRINRYLVLRKAGGFSLVWKLFVMGEFYGGNEQGMLETLY
jgi:hypothetical protein